MRTGLKTVVTLLLVVSILEFYGTLGRSAGQAPTVTAAMSTVTSSTTVQTPCLAPTAADITSTQILPASINGTVRGHVVPVVSQKQAHVVGKLPSQIKIKMELVFDFRNADKFYACLASINDPKSADYGHYLNLTTMQPYLPTPGQKSSIISYFTHKGFNVTFGASPLVLKMSASVKDVEATFGVKINLYSIANSSFYGVDVDLSLPQNFVSMVSGIMGLDNYTVARPAESPCSGPYCPQGIQVGYSLSSLYTSGYDGTGQKVAIVDVPGDPNMQTALNTFSSQYGLAATTIDIRYPDGVPSSYDPGWASETAMDIEAVHSVAPRAGIILLYDDVSLMNAVDYVATNHLATIVSNSWGYICGPPPYHACSDTQLPPSFVSSVDLRLALDASQGLTILFASGDAGAKPDGTSLGTEFPASDPNVLAVGATNLVLSGCTSTTCSGYSSESGASISGGGYSGYFAEPSWQTSTVGFKSGRAVPDVSMLGYSPNFWVYSTASDKCGAGGSSAGWFGCAGTSLSTPLWAGFLAVALQARGGSGFGNIGPLIYQLGSGASYPTIFHDVTSGSNNGYSAGTGWDPVTGWGSPIANNFVSSLAAGITFYTIPSTFSEASTPGSITVSGIACSGTFTNGQSSKSCGGSFPATANLPTPSTGWQFDHWISAGGVACTFASNTASCTVSASGSLTAVYAVQVTFGSALISWGSCANPPQPNGVTIFSTAGSATACYVPTGYSVSSWSCSGGMTCSGSNNPTIVMLNGPGTIALNLKTGSLSNPVSTSLTASASPSSLHGGTSFTVSGTLTANGAGLSGEQIVLVFGWNSNMVVVTTQPDGSYSYTATAPVPVGSYDIRVFFLGDLGGGTQYLPSTATASINVS